MDNSKEARARAEENFKKKELQARENEKARAEYDAQGRATRQKTERLKALRLAQETTQETTQESAGKEPEKLKVAKKPARKPKSSR
jgi:hypothetical protein